PGSCTTSLLFFFQAEHGIRAPLVTGVQTCALPILSSKHGCRSCSPPDDPPPRGLQLRQPCFDDMRLLAALEMFAPLAYPFLAFRSEERRVGKEVMFYAVYEQ